MWSYYGSKSKVVNFYPKPICDKIIEPFAGSARYSLKYFEKDVLLIDPDTNIVRLWKWLQQCSMKDILGLPNFKQGDNIKDFNLSSEELLFCGFLIAKGVSSPQFVASKWTTTMQPTWIPYQIKRIASELFKIRHWTIKEGVYSDSPNCIATWFIDPPYQFGGEYYRHSNKNIDFSALAEWSKGRKGQSIVCENTRADWMSFIPVRKLQGSIHKSTEVMWTNQATSYGTIQQELFAI